MEDCRILYFKSTGGAAAGAPRGHLLLNPRSCVVCPAQPLNALGQKGAFLVLVFAEGLHMKNCPARAVARGVGCVCSEEVKLLCRPHLEAAEGLFGSPSLARPLHLGDADGACRGASSSAAKALENCAPPRCTKEGAGQRRPFPLSAELLGVETQQGADTPPAAAEGGHRALGGASRKGLSELPARLAGDAAEASQQQSFRRVLALAVEKVFAAADSPKFAFAFSSLKEQQRWTLAIRRQVALSGGFALTRLRLPVSAARSLSSLAKSALNSSAMGAVGRGGASVARTPQEANGQRELSASSTRGTASSVTSPARSGCLRDASKDLQRWASPVQGVVVAEAPQPFPLKKSAEGVEALTEGLQPTLPAATTTPPTDCLEALLFLLEREHHQQRRRLAEEGAESVLQKKQRPALALQEASMGRDHAAEAQAALALAEAIAAVRRSRALLVDSRRRRRAAFPSEEKSEEALPLELPRLPASSDLLRALIEARRVLQRSGCLECKPLFRKQQTPNDDDAEALRAPAAGASSGAGSWSAEKKAARREEEVLQLRVANSREEEETGAVPEDDHVRLLQSLVLVLLERIERQTQQTPQTLVEPPTAEREDAHALAELRRVFETFKFGESGGDSPDLADEETKSSIRGALKRSPHAKRDANWWISESDSEDAAACPADDNCPAPPSAMESEVTIFRLCTPSSSGTSSRASSCERAPSCETRES